MIFYNINFINVLILTSELKVKIDELLEAPENIEMLNESDIIDAQKNLEIFALNSLSIKDEGEWVIVDKK